MPSNGPSRPAPARSSARAVDEPHRGGPGLGPRRASMLRRGVNGDDLRVRGGGQQRGGGGAGAAAGVEQAQAPAVAGQPQPPGGKPQVGVVAGVGADQPVVGGRAGVERRGHGSGARVMLTVGLLRPARTAPLVLPQQQGRGDQGEAEQEVFDRDVQGKRRPVMAAWS